MATCCQLQDPASQVGYPDLIDGTKGGNPRRDNQKVRERKYGHLTAAARAKQEREQPHLRGDSSRYSSDPIKFTREKGKSK